MKIPTEHEEQVAFVQWFEAQYPAIRIFAVPNGERRHIAVARRLKREGVRRGIPDLYIPAWKLWIEMKRTKGGTLSANQKDWIQHLKKLGDSVFVCRGCEDAIKQVSAFVIGNNLM